MEVLAVPPISLSPVADSNASWVYMEAQQPVDFTATVDDAEWSAEFLIENCGKVVFRAAADLDAQGGISVTIPQGTSAALRSSRRIDGHYQIRFSAPLPDFDMVWQGPVVVLEITE